MSSQARLPLEEREGEAPTGGSIDPWQLEETGERWCDCPQGDHQVDAIMVTELFDDFGFFEGDLVPHAAVAAVCQKLWSYIEVCAFFNDHVNLSAQTIYGRLAERYPFEVSLDIVGYFSKTWHGCPEQACNGDYDWFSELPEPEAEF